MTTIPITVSPAAEAAYRIETHRYGKLIFGLFPTTDLGLVTSFAEQGLDVMNINVAQALGATFALCAATDCEAWEAEINANAQAQADGDKLTEWLHGTHVGTSSLSIAYGITRRQDVLNKLRRGLLGADVPSDPSDFMRCYRLLETVPGLREQLARVPEVFPFWQPLIDCWEWLETLYVQGIANDRNVPLYDELQKLNETAFTLRQQFHADLRETTQ